MTLPDLSRAPASVRTLLTLIAAVIGGAIFAYLHLPAAWLAGSLVAVSALALAGAPVYVPDLLRKIIFVVLGISLGAAVTPETLAGIRTWPITLSVLVLSLPATMAAVMLYLHYVSGWKYRETLYASAPGALSAVLAMAADAKVDVRMVAFVQTVRVFFLIAALPGALLAAGLSPHAGAVPPAAAVHTASLNDMLIMAGTGIASALIAERLRVPAGLMIGPMIVNGVLHGSGYVQGNIPPVLLLISFVVLGAFTGTRFAGTTAAMIRRLFLDSIGAFVVAMIVAVIFAFAASWLSGEDIAKTILAFAPGGLEAMTILAFLIGLDPAFVGAHHLVRFLLIAALLPFIARLLMGKGAEAIALPEAEQEERAKKPSLDGGGE
ncbi:MAG: AbrB family transcriptional regulator [Xanthobacteraceae bacterium]|nr:AbrB family transcriptional regulator [Xanthobacteraceae bacterium]QYK45379.1 MAG: AbrB family transcriptional regulator [Xanthobacteraceae bacterium]